jgi:DNA processing protein
VKESDAALVTIGDLRCPESLRKICDPPILLFARGRLGLPHSIMLGVVGTRRPTPYGLAAAERLAGDLARTGLTIE